MLHSATHVLVCNHLILLYSNTCQWHLQNNDVHHGAHDMLRLCHGIPGPQG